MMETYLENLMVGLGIGAVFAIGVLLYIIYGVIKDAIEKKGRKRTAAKGVNTNNINVKEEMTQAFTKLNCEVEWEEVDKENKLEEAHIKYQNGKFQLRSIDESTGVIFYSIHPFPAETIDIIRHYANNINRSNDYFKCIYGPRGESNEVSVWFAMTVTKALCGGNLTEILREALKECFAGQSYLINGIEEARKNNAITNDVDIDRLENEREAYLKFEREIAHQTNTEEKRFSDTKALRLTDAIKILYGQEDGIKEVCISSNGECKCIKEQEEIEATSILDTIIDGEGKEAKFARNEATITISNEDGSTYTMLVRKAHEDEKALYARIFTYRSAGEKEIAINEYATQAMQINAILVAYDKTTESNREAEYRFMAEDAKDKVEQGKQSELTDEQKFILNGDDSIGKDLYFGRKHYLAKRYYEAILHLEKAYNFMQSRFHNLKKNELNTFSETCNQLGFCYNELKRYDRALYFLDYGFKEGNINASIEYINSLVNSKDYRAYKTINDELAALTNGRSKEEIEENGWANFWNFLRRRKAYVLIDLGQIDKAEELWKEMLNEPENEEMARRELSFINTLRRKNSQRRKKDTLAEDDEEGKEEGEEKE